MKIRWRRVVAVMAAFFFAGLAAAYWMLAGLDVNRFKPGIVEAVKTATGRELTVGGDIRLQIGIRPTLAVEDVRFQNAQWGSRRDMMRLRRLELQIAAWPLLFGNLDIRRILLVAPDLLLETRPDGEWNLPKLRSGAAADTDASDSRSEELLRHLTFASARIEGGRLAWRNGRSGKTSALSIKTIRSGMTDLQSPIRLTMEAVYNGRRLQATGSVGRLFRLLDETQQWPVDLSLTAGRLRADVSGTIRSPASGRGGVDLVCKVEGESLAEWKHFIPDWPPSLRDEFAAAFRFTDPAGDRLRFSDLRVSAGQSDFSGWVEIGHAGPRPRVTAEIHSSQVVIASRPQRTTRAASGGGKGKVFSTERIDFGMLERIDAEIRMTADRLQSPMLATDRIDLSLKIENGEAALRPVMVQVEEGYAEGRVSVRPSGRGAWISLRLTVREMPVERILPLFTRTPLLAGKMDANLRLLSSGNSVADLMAGLDGELFWIMGKGKIRTRHIDRLAGEAAGGIVRYISPTSDKTRDAQLNCLVAEIEVARGIAHCRGLLLDTDRTTIAGDGEIDLSDETIDITMDPSPKRGVGVKGLGGLTLSLGELGNPFKLGGTLASPQLTLDTAGAAITIGKAFGGFTFAGPLGLAAALADFSSAGDNPCLKAIETFKKENAEKIQP